MESDDRNALKKRARELAKASSSGCTAELPLKERPVEYIFPANVDRTFVAEALRAAADRFEYLANASDEKLFEHYEIKRAVCLRLAGEIDADK